MDINEILNWRYASKRMSGAKVSQEKIDTILKAIQLAPTSLGLQPFHVFAIEDKALLQTISEKSCQQPQVAECSHLLVFAARTSITDAFVDQYIQLIVDTRNVPAESLAPYRGMINMYKDKSPADLLDWTARQVYIAFGVGLVAAASVQVDSTPIEGFSPEAMDEILDLKAKGLHSVVLIALGYRDEAKDHHAKAKKVRKHLTDLVTVI